MALPCHFRFLLGGRKIMLGVLMKGSEAENCSLLDVDLSRQNEVINHILFRIYVILR